MSEKIVLTDAEKRLDIRAIVEEIQNATIQKTYNHATVYMIGRVALALTEGLVEGCRMRDVYRQRLVGAEFARDQYLAERDEARKDADYWKAAHMDDLKDAKDARQDLQNQLDSAKADNAKLRNDLDAAQKVADDWEQEAKLNGHNAAYWVRQCNEAYERYRKLIADRDRAIHDSIYWRTAHAEDCKDLAATRDERNRLRIEAAELRRELEQECAWPTAPFEQALYGLGDYHDEQAPNGPEDDPFREIAQADSYQLHPATIPLIRLERNLSHARPDLHTSDLRAIAHDAVLAYSYALSQDSKEDIPGDVDEGEDAEQEATPEAAY